MSNYKVLFSLRMLKNILTGFVDSFLVLYFMEVSYNNILPLGLYKLVAVIAIYSVIFLTRNFAKSKHRVYLMRIGILLDFIYFLTIILLKDKIINYIYLVGLLYGLEEGFYYSIYNILETDGITNEERTKFTGTSTAIQSILSIIFPILFGSLIYTTGFLKTLVIVLIIVILRIILSFVFKDENVPKANKINFKEYFKITQKDKRFKEIYKLEFFNGMTYSEGAFSYIVTIYIIKVFSNSFSLGIFTSIFSIITCVIGILFAKYIKRKYYALIIKISTILTVIALCSIIIKCNAITIILFNLFQTISRSIINLVNENNQRNLSNIEEIKKEYKGEYWLICETCLVIARIISSSIFILMTYMDSRMIMIAFIAVLILLAKHSVELQEKMEK